MGLQAPATVSGMTWDRSMVLPSPSTMSERFAIDGRSAVKARSWVEEVIGEKLPQNTFGEAFKNGVGLCQLINAFRPGTIAKIETSTSPFKQMANISAFIQSCRKLGVREHTLFETLDLFNEKRLPQVVRCLFSLSELVRTTMPEFPGPYLSAPDKPEVDPAVKAVVEIAKGNISASGLGPLTPARQNTGGSAANGAGAGGGGEPCPPGSVFLSLPHQAEQAGGCCLSPARAAGRLTYGVYEGGGGSKMMRGAGSNDSANGSGGSRSVKPGTPKALVLERGVSDGYGGSFVEGAGGAGRGPGGGDASETVASTLPAVHTPRMMPTPAKARLRGEYLSRTSSPSIPRTPRDPLAGESKITLEDLARRKREATAKADAELEAALWIEGVTGVTFPGKFWSSLKDGALLCKLVNVFRPGLVPHVNKARAPFPEMENITAFLTACRALGVAEHSLFDTKDLHEKRDMEMVVRCLHVLADAVQSSIPDFRGPFLGKRTDAYSRLNARGLRKQLGKGPGARGGIPNLGGLKAMGRGVGGRAPMAEALVEHMDPTATVTPADSPSFKKANRAHAGSDSAAGSEVVSPLHARPCPNGDCAVPPNGSGEGAAAATTMPEEGHCCAGRDKVVFGSVGGSAVNRRRSQRVEDTGESVVSQIQSFIEHNTGMPWRLTGNMYESLRDGWQLALLANALRPNAIRRIHNSIQQPRQVQNIANFLIASRRMGVARTLLFDVDDLYANRSMTKVARTLLALRVLASDPDFSRERASALTGSSLLVSAVAAAAQTRSETSSSVAPAGLWS